MTPDEAKACLSLCPPEDETNPDVPGLAEARDLAATNPELGAWWEQEKSFDALFSRKLSSYSPPPELQPTIMRGGATIFFASKLIADSTEDEEVAPLPDMPLSSRRSPLEEVRAQADRGDLAEMESKLAKRWIWRMGFVMVGVIGALVLAYLFFFEYSIASKDVAAQAHSGVSGELAKLETIATALPAAGVAATQTGPLPAERQKYLDDNQSPNPAKLPGFIAQPAPGTVITVTAENWNYFPITHYVAQSGTALSHLIILKASALHPGNIPTEDFSAVRGSFKESIWSADGFVFIQLTPTAPAP